MNNRKKLTLEYFKNLPAKLQAYIFETKIGTKQKYTFKNRVHKKFFGKGILDVEFPTEIIIEGERVYHPAFRTWRNMLSRAYYDKHKERYNCSVCEEWHSFGTFLAWWWDNAPNSEHYSRYQLDKDHEANLLKVYSPEYCFFVPQCVNLQDRRSRKTGKLFNIN